MWVEVYWLPHVGAWTEAVHGAVAAGMVLIGAMCAAGLALRCYRLGLQVLAWALGK